MRVDISEDDIREQVEKSVKKVVKEIVKEVTIEAIKEDVENFIRERGDVYLYSQIHECFNARIEHAVQYYITHHQVLDGTEFKEADEALKKYYMEVIENEGKDIVKDIIIDRVADKIKRNYTADSTQRSALAKEIIRLCQEDNPS